jgi:hypothetical protein
MKKQDKTIRVYCGHEGCHESGFFCYDNRKECLELQSKYGQGKWRCVRHTCPNEVLSKENLKTQKIVVSGKSKKYPELKEFFWDDSSGFIYGTGYRAFANDFPEGTKLIVTAEIKLPE